MAKTAAKAAPNPATRESIVALATEMLTKNGYNGVSFLSLGKQLGIGHSNIHYYFKTKDDLVEYVLKLYTDEVLKYFKAVWRDPEVDLRRKMQMTRDGLLSNYNKFNKGDSSGRIGLLGSMAADVEHLSSGAKQILRDVNVGLDEHIREGIAISVERGDLVREAPREEIALQILWLLYSSRIIVRHGSKFDNLDTLFRWTTEVIELAYGSPSAEARRQPAAELEPEKPARATKLARTQPL